MNCSQNYANINWKKTEVVLWISGKINIKARKITSNKMGRKIIKWEGWLPRRHTFFKISVPKSSMTEYELQTDKNWKKTDIIILYTCRITRQRKWVNKLELSWHFQDTLHRLQNTHSSQVHRRLHQEEPHSECRTHFNKFKRLGIILSVTLDHNTIKLEINKR